MRLRLLPAILAGLAMSCPAIAEPHTSSQTTPQASAGVIGSAPQSPASSSPGPSDEATKPVSQQGPADKPVEGAPEPTSASETADPLVVVEKPKPLPPTLIARINLSKQQMELSVAGVPKYTWAVSSGRQGYETPRGTFKAQWTARLWHSRAYDLAPMPHAVFFHNGAAVHATSSVGLLGQPASHGCVRLAPANAALFYALVQKHGTKATQIQVFGKELAPRIARKEAPRLASYGGQTITYLPPGSPYAGRQSFVHNGIVYVRVR